MLTRRIAAFGDKNDNKFVLLFVYGETISIPESSAYFVSGWSPGNDIRRPTADKKKPEDSGVEIGGKIK